MPLIDRIALTQFAEQILTRAGMEPTRPKRLPPSWWRAT